MNKLSRVLLSSVVSLIVVAVTPFGHVSAMQSSSMHHDGMSSTPEHCAMLCQNTGAKKEYYLQDIDSEEEDEPVSPYYLQFESVNSGLFIEKKIVPTSQNIHIPEKVPKYRSCCVVRR